MLPQDKFSHNGCHIKTFNDLQVENSITVKDLNFTICMVKIVLGKAENVFLGGSIFVDWTVVRHGGGHQANFVSLIDVVLGESLSPDQNSRLPTQTALVGGY